MASPSPPRSVSLPPAPSQHHSPSPPLPSPQPDRLSRSHSTPLNIVSNYTPTLQAEPTSMPGPDLDGSAAAARQEKQSEGVSSGKELEGDEGDKGIEMNDQAKEDERDATDGHTTPLQDVPTEGPATAEGNDTPSSKANTIADPPYSQDLSKGQAEDPAAEVDSEIDRLGEAGNGVISSLAETDPNEAGAEHEEGRSGDANIVEERNSAMKEGDEGKDPATPGHSHPPVNQPHHTYSSPTPSPWIPLTAAEDASTPQDTPTASFPVAGSTSSHGLGGSVTAEKAMQVDQEQKTADEGESVVAQNTENVQAQVTVPSGSSSIEAKIDLSALSTTGPAQRTSASGLDPFNGEGEQALVDVTVEGMDLDLDMHLDLDSAIHNDTLMDIDNPSGGDDDGFGVDQQAGGNESQALTQAGVQHDEAKGMDEVELPEQTGLAVNMAEVTDEGKTDQAKATLDEDVEMAQAEPKGDGDTGIEAPDASSDEPSRPPSLPSLDANTADSMDVDHLPLTEGKQPDDNSPQAEHAEISSPSAVTAQAGPSQSVEAKSVIKQDEQANVVLESCQQINDEKAADIANRDGDPITQPSEAAVEASSIEQTKDSEGEEPISPTSPPAVPVAATGTRLDKHPFSAAAVSAMADLDPVSAPVRSEDLANVEPQHREGEAAQVARSSPPLNVSPLPASAQDSYVSSSAQQSQHDENADLPASSSPALTKDGSPLEPATVTPLGQAALPASGEVPRSETMNTTCTVQASQESQSRSHGPVSYENPSPGDNAENVEAEAPVSDAGVRIEPAMNGDTADTIGVGREQYTSLKSDTAPKVDTELEENTPNAGEEPTSDGIEDPAHSSHIPVKACSPESDCDDGLFEEAQAALTAIRRQKTGAEDMDIDDPASMAQGSEQKRMNFADEGEDGQMDFAEEEDVLKTPLRKTLAAATSSTDTMSYESTPDNTHAIGPDTPTPAGLGSKKRKRTTELDAAAILKKKFKPPMMKTNKLNLYLGLDKQAPFIADTEELPELDPPSSSSMPSSSPLQTPARRESAYERKYASKRLSKPFKAPVDSVSGHASLQDAIPDKSATAIRQELVELENRKQLLVQAVKISKQPDEGERLKQLVQQWLEAGRTISEKLFDSMEAPIAADSGGFGDRTFRSSGSTSGRQAEAEPMPWNIGTMLRTLSVDPDLFAWSAEIEDWKL